jgi:D-lyxose ketol-isomerase
MAQPSIKRSRVNEIMRESDAFIRSFGYILPPFAYWSPSEVKARKVEAKMIIERNCGWDITDYGLGTFDQTGLFLFTVRNGNNADLGKGRGMLYAEKAMISRKDQYSPMHRHNLKAEDIINRGGGTLVIELYGDTGGKCDKSKGVEVYCDGVLRKLPPGGKLQLKPGESVTLMPNEHWHAFWGEGGDVFIGEVSTVNDDNTDNVFDDPKIARFGGIEEDEEPWHLLVSDYKKWLA